MKKWIKDFLKIFILILFTIAIGTLTLLSIFLQSVTEALLALGWLGLTTLVSLCMTISFVVLLAKKCKSINNIEKVEELDNINISGKQEPRVFDAIIIDLKKMMEKREYSDVIRVGSSLSRALWISGEYQNRIIIGTLVYDAACSTQNDFARATTLIDDIGWTYTLLSDNAKAKANILKGIICAEKVGKNYWIAKGYRHLFNIELLEGHSKERVKKAQEYLLKAEEYANAIDHEYSKNEMIYGISYDKIELLILKENYVEAECKGIYILEQYKMGNDDERVAKLQSLLGKLAYIQADYPRASDYFLEGLAVAERSRRTDEMIKNSMGLAVSKYMEGNVDRCEFYKSACKSYMEGRNIKLIFWDNILVKYNEIK